MSAPKTEVRISKRVRWYREQRQLTQEDLARLVGFEHRQTVASIESGERRIAPNELVAMASALGVTLLDLTDPYRLVGEGAFSFRVARDVSEEDLAGFSEYSGSVLALYRALGEKLGCESPVLSQRLSISLESTFEDAQEAAESLWRHWQLGPVPAARLEGAIWENLGVSVFYVDSPEFVSGAATRVSDIQAIFVNRREPRGRRNYDIAHELFHILTWDALPPARIEPQSVRPVKGNRIEQLANNFAASLLMPSALVNERWTNTDSGDLKNWLLATADWFRVSAQALQWRLVSMKLLSKAALIDLIGEARAADVRDLPHMFNRQLAERVREAIARSILSASKAAKVLSLSLGELSGLFESYGLENPYSPSLG